LEKPKQKEEAIYEKGTAGFFDRRFAITHGGDSIAEL
jgi:hypothetical protein